MSLIAPFADAERLPEFSPQPERVSAWRKISRHARIAVVPILLIVIWQVASSNGWISPSVLPSPSDIVSTFNDKLSDGTLLPSIGISLRRVLIGSSIGIGLAVCMGTLSGLSRLGQDLFDGPMLMLQAMPFPGLVPLLMVWLGIGESIKIGIVAIGSFFPVYINIARGIRGLDPRLRELARTRGVGRWQMIRHIVLPGVLPQFLVGLRFSLAIAWLCLIFGETIAADSGIGYMMMQAETFNETNVIVLGLVIYAILGLLVDQFVRFLEWRLLRWKREFVS